VLGLGFGSVVALKYAARHPEHPSALVLAAPIARVHADRSIAAYERLGGADARAVAERFYDGMDEQGFADFLRVCFPLLSSYALTSDVIARADWNPAVLMEWMRGEAKELDLREELASIRTPALVLAGEEDAWAPLESVQEVYELLGGHKRFRSYPEGRHSIFRDAPEAYDDMRVFLDDIQALELRS
jgi:pimeloyl-ACP methyl ester carboxylesterase